VLNYAKASNLEKVTDQLVNQFGRGMKSLEELASGAGKLTKFTKNYESIRGDLNRFTKSVILEKMHRFALANGGKGIVYDKVGRIQLKAIFCHKIMVEQRFARVACSRIDTRLEYFFVRARDQNDFA